MRRNADPGPAASRAAWCSRILLSVIGAVIGVTLFGAGAALAYWVTTDSSNPAVAAAATLAVPTAGAQNGTATPASVPVKWTAPLGYTSGGYTVLRCTGSSCTSFTAISNGTCSGLITATSCTDTDTALAAGTTYRYEVQAHLDNWVSSPGSAFTAATSALTQLVFTTQPASGANIQATGTGTFSVAVAIEDANGVKATKDNSDHVTLAIDPANDPGSGTLTCTGGLTATVSSGVASFSGCAITKAGNGYKLTASSSTDTSLTAPANANSFNITAGSLSQLVATSGASQSATALGAFTSPLVATAEDANGNPVSGVAVTFSGPSSSTTASVTFATTGCTSNPHAYSCVVTSAANGQATSSAFTANTHLGSYTISAAATGASSASFAESNVKTSISSLVAANGTGTAGKIDSGDTITITFSGQIDASRVCSAWTDNLTTTQTALGSTVSVNNTGTGNDDVLTFSHNPTGCTSFNFGSIDLGSTQYVTSPGGSHQAVTFSNSTISYNGTTHTLQITLGTLGGSGTENTVSSSILTLTLSASVVDAGDNALTSNSFATAAGSQF